MRATPTCRTCDRGRLHLIPLRRHGEIAAFFGSALVVVSLLLGIAPFAAHAALKEPAPGR